MIRSRNSFATSTGRLARLRPVSRPSSDPSRRLEWNPTYRPDLTGQGLCVRGWLATHECLQFDFPPMDPRPDLILRDWERRFPEGGDQTSHATPGLSRTTQLPSSTRKHASLPAVTTMDGTGAPELPGSPPLSLPARPRVTTRWSGLQEALEGHGGILCDPGGFFVDGVESAPMPGTRPPTATIGRISGLMTSCRRKTARRNGRAGTSCGRRPIRQPSRIICASLPARKSPPPLSIPRRSPRHCVGSGLYRDALAQGLEKGDSEIPRFTASNGPEAKHGRRR